MALTELLQTLEDEARQRVNDLLAQARAEADRLRRESAAEGDRLRGVALHARETELRADAARRLEAARREATRQVLEARAAALGAIRARAEERLAAGAGDPAWLPRLRRDLAEGLRYLDAVPVVVEADAALLGELRAAGGGRELRFEAATGHHGLVLRSADGALTVDASLEARLERAWPALAMDLVRRLEEGP
ncbi:MAG TPA: V-type ATP synthase subunit E [Gemmatimonadales bacterium]